MFFSFVLCRFVQRGRNVSTRDHEKRATRRRTTPTKSFFASKVFSLFLDRAAARFRARSRFNAHHKKMARTADRSGTAAKMRQTTKKSSAWYTHAQRQQRDDERGEKSKREKSVCARTRVVRVGASRKERFFIRERLISQGKFIVLIPLKISPLLAVWV